MRQRTAMLTTAVLLGVAFSGVIAACSTGSSSTTNPPESSLPAAPVTQPAPPPNACRGGDPLANVYHPYRLAVLNRCVTATGTVEGVKTEPDGDSHIDVALDPAFHSLLNSVNQSAQHRYLVVELVPADKPGCSPGEPPRPPNGSYDYGLCTGASIATPSTGDCVSITGPHVSDNEHGWNEIHPAWAINVTGHCQADPSFTMPSIEDEDAAPSPKVDTAPAPAPASPPESPSSGNSGTQTYWYCWDSGPPNPHHTGHHMRGDHPCTNTELGR